MFRDGAERLLVFRVGEERFGVALSAVREVIDSPAVSRVPDAAPSLLGVAMVRDELVPVYDSRALLEVGQTGGSPGAALLFSVDDRRVALAIDDVFDPILVEERELRPMPGAGAKDTNIRGLVRRDGDLVAVLDEGALLDTMLATASGFRSGLMLRGSMLARLAARSISARSMGSHSASAGERASRSSQRPSAALGSPACASCRPR